MQALRTPQRHNLLRGIRSASCGGLAKPSSLKNQSLRLRPVELNKQCPRDMEPGENPGQLALLYPVTMSHDVNLSERRFAVRAVGSLGEGGAAV